MRRAADAGWRSSSRPEARCVHVGGAAHGGRLFRENVRGHLRYLSLHGRPGEAERARRLLRASLLVRGRLYRGERGAALPRGRRAGSARRRRRAARRMSRRDELRLLLLQLVFGVRASCSRPGALLARALGVRGASATLAWALALVFGALAVTFLVSASLDPHARARPRRAASAALPSASCAAPRELVLNHHESPARGRGARGRRAARAPPLARRGTRRRRRLLPPRADPEARSRSATSRSRRANEFPDGGLHPGYAFPLWHGFLALVAKVSGADPVDVVLHGPTRARAARGAGRLRGGLGALPPRRPGRRLRRGGRRDRRDGARARAARSRRSRFPRRRRGSCSSRLRSRSPSRRRGGRRPRSSPRLPPPRSPSRSSTRRTRSSSGSRSPGSSSCAGSGSAATRERAASRSRRSSSPPALFFAWLLPVIGDTASVEPGRERARARLRAVRRPARTAPPTGSPSSPELFGRTGAVAVAALLLLPLAGLAARRRWAAYVVGRLARRLRRLPRPLDLHAVLRRRLALPVASARRLPAARVRARGRDGRARAARRAGGRPARPRGGDRPPARSSRATSATRWRTAGRRGRRGSPSSARSSRSALGFRRPPSARADGRARVGARPAADVRPRARALDAVRGAASEPALGRPHRRGSRRRCRSAPSSTPTRGELPARRVRARSACASTLRATSPTRSTTVPRSAIDAFRRFVRTGDLAIPRACGATWLVVDRERFPHLAPGLPVGYRDARWVLYRL